MPSLASSSSSIITSLPLPLRSLGSYLIGQASVIDEARACVGAGLVLDDDHHLLALVLIWPAETSACHLKRSSAFAPTVMPHLSVTLPYLVRPAELADVRRIGALAIVDRVDGRLGDRDLAEAGLRDAVDLQAEAEIAERILRAMGRLLLALRFSGVLEDAEDDELGRPDRRDADLADQPAVEDVVLRSSSCGRR